MLKKLVFCLVFCFIFKANGQELIARPETGLQLALQYNETLSPEIRPFVRYLWLNELEDYGAIVAALNFAVNKSSLPVSPQRFENIVIVNFLQYSDDLNEVKRLMNVWDNMASVDPYYSLTIPERREGKKTIPSQIIPAPYLNTVFRPGSIYRADWWLVLALQSQDNGFYYKFRGLKGFNPNKDKPKGDETKLNGYLISLGASFETARKQNAVESAVVNISEVTKKRRKIRYWPSQTTRPTAGRSVVFITEDTFDDNDSTASDPLASLLNNKADGKELFVILSNGFIEYTIWNADGILTTEAPASLVSDHFVPDGFTKRLGAGLNCIRCHGSENGFRSFHNDVRSILGNNGRLLGDLSKLSSDEAQFKAVKQVLFEFNAEDLAIKNLLQEVRQNLDNQFFKVTSVLGNKNRVNADFGSANITKVFNRYEYPAITPDVAVKELGLTLLKDDILGVDTLRIVVPPLSLDGSIPDAPTITELEAKWLDIETNKERSGKSPRRKWEQVYQIAASRSLPLIKAIQERKPEKQDKK